MAVLLFPVFCAGNTDPRNASKPTATFKLLKMPPPLPSAMLFLITTPLSVSVPLLWIAPPFWLLRTLLMAPVQVARPSAPRAAQSSDDLLAALLTVDARRRNEDREA